MNSAPVRQIDTADLLAETREYIEENGRIREQLLDTETGKVCSVGGMLMVLDVSDVDSHALDPRVVKACGVLVDTLHLRQHQPGDCTRDGLCVCTINWVTTWNDEDVDGVQEVLDAFAKAEKIERMGYDPDLGYSE